MQALYPHPVATLDDAAILDRYRAGGHPFVRFNFVSSLDGSAQLDGRSAALGSPADARVFGLLRRLASVVLVGSGTVRAEGYDGPLLDEAGRAWRVERGLAEHPTLAIISHGLNIDPDAKVLVDSPAPVLLFTNARPDAQVLARYPKHVEVISLDPAPGHWCNAPALVSQLHSRGLGFVHAEGGPRIFGQFITQKVIDSLCLSISPVLAAGQGDRISNDEATARLDLSLHSILEEDGMLLTEYRRDAGPSATGSRGEP